GRLPAVRGRRHPAGGFRAGHRRRDPRRLRRGAAHRGGARGGRGGGRRGRVRRGARRGGVTRGGVTLGSGGEGRGSPSDPLRCSHTGTGASRTARRPGTVSGVVRPASGRVRTPRSTPIRASTSAGPHPAAPARSTAPAPGKRGAAP